MCQFTGAGSEARKRRNRRTPMLGLILGASFFWLSAAGTARATEWMYCSDKRSQVSLGLLMGFADAWSASGATLTAPAAAYSSNSLYGKGEEFSIRYVRTRNREDRIELDFVRSSDDKLVAGVRLRSGKSADKTVYRGKLTMPGKGSWAVSCDAE